MDPCSLAPARVSPPQGRRPLDELDVAIARLEGPSTDGADAGAVVAVDTDDDAVGIDLVGVPEDSLVGNAVTDHTGDRDVGRVGTLLYVSHALGELVLRLDRQ